MRDDERLPGDFLPPARLPLDEFIVGHSPKRFAAEDLRVAAWRLLGREALRAAAAGRVVGPLSNANFVALVADRLREWFQASDVHTDRFASALGGWLVEIGGYRAPAWEVRITGGNVEVELLKRAVDRWAEGSAGRSILSADDRARFDRDRRRSAEDLDLQHSSDDPIATAQSEAPTTRKLPAVVD